MFLRLFPQSAGQQAAGLGHIRARLEPRVNRPTFTQRSQQPSAHVVGCHPHRRLGIGPAALALIAQDGRVRSKADCYTFPSKYSWLVNIRELFTSLASWVNRRLGK